MAKEMIDTTVDDGEGEQTASRGKGANYIKDAGEQFLASLGDTAAEGTDEDSPAPRATKTAAKSVSKATSKVTGKAKADAADEGPAVEAEASADADEDSPYTEDADAEATDDDLPDEAEASEDDAPTGTTIVLAGEAERGEEDIEITIDDPAVVERLRRLQNSGMRGKQYRESMAALRAEQAELRDITLEIDVNPHGFILEKLGPEMQLQLAEALLAEHFDKLVPVINKFVDDPAEAPKVREGAAKQMRENDRTLAQRKAGAQFAEECRTEVETLIPDTATRDQRERFFRDAERDLLDAAKRGELRSPRDVPRLIADRIRLYGFQSADTSRRSAKPGTERARSIAEQKRLEAEEHQRRVKQSRHIRTASKAVVPGGRGTAAVRKPVVADNDNIEQASDKLRKLGGNSWANVKLT